MARCGVLLLMVTAVATATFLIVASVLYRVSETPFETAGHLILPPLAQFHQAVVAAKHGSLKLVGAREAHRQQEGKVLVTIMSEHWWTDIFGADWLEPWCSPLQCRFVSVVNNSKLTKAEKDELVASASAHLYHLCPGPRHPAAKASTPVVATYAESAANHPCIDDATVMQQASIDFSFRSCAQVGAQPVQVWPHGCSLATLHCVTKKSRLVGHFAAAGMSGLSSGTTDLHPAAPTVQGAASAS